ncbi:MAG: 5' nucleotidase, NT5C type [Candidatus Woesearchaeota archaeon]
MILLVDMDGVIADFEQGFLDIYRVRHPDKPFIPIEDRSTFYLTDDYPADLVDMVRDITMSVGFFYSLPPIEGALEALPQLLVKNDVYICTSPLLENRTCVQEKYDWIQKYLGTKWKDRMILTKDKTLIEGDYLIDDKPNIKGIVQPSWEQLLYYQPYNSHVQDKIMITWNNYQEVMDLCK